MQRSTSFDLPPYSPQTPRNGGKEFGPWGGGRADIFNPWTADGRPRLKTSKSTTTLQQVKGAFEERYGSSPVLPSGNPHLQSQFTPFGLGLRRPLARKFDPHRQLLKLFARGLGRWLVTVILVGASVATLSMYSHPAIISETQKRIFNAIITGLMLALNLNIQSAFKQVALYLRWKIISHRRQTLRELDLTLGVDSFLKVAELAWISKRNPMVLLGCLFWLLLNMSVITFVSILQLTYGLEDAGGKLIQPGVVQVANFQHFYPSNDSSVIPSVGSEQATAHMFGYSSYAYLQANASDFARSLESTREMPVWWLTYNLGDHWVYQQSEGNPVTLQENVYTNRTVNVTWTCTSWDVVEGGDGTADTIKYADGNDTFDFEVGSVSPNAITYLTETEEVCGPRCARVWAFQTVVPEKEIEPMLYDCNITVSNVSNAYMPEHVLPDMQARIAAGAIGLEGFQQGNSTRQRARYHQGSWWAIKQGNSPQDVGWMIGQFAAGTIGVAGVQNPTFLVEGHIGVTGVYLNVHWRNALVILIGLAASQLIVLAVGVLLANSVIVKDHSDLATARLLRPLVERLGSAGCVLDGHDISKTLQGKFVYGVRQAGGWNHLDIGQDIRPLSFFGSFPAGWYDGEAEVDEDRSSDDARVSTNDEEEPGGDTERERHRGGGDAGHGVGNGGLKLKQE